MKEICLGNCLAQNYYRSKSLWEPFWFCEEALRQGLFPNTRIVQNRLTRDDNNHGIGKF
jgi:hypothetical protein